ncbi:MAG: M3 family peptidase [Bacteroidetes bacterium]|nr:MAG: M3 family peptidase [Bacteroidota bacterium]
MSQNSLLQFFDTPYQTPPFDRIKEEEYLPAFKAAMAIAKKEIEQVAANTAEPSFENSIEALEKSGKQLTAISNIFFNLNHAATNENIQAIAREVMPLLTEYSNDIWLNTALFNRVKQVYDTRETLPLRPDQQKLLEDTYKEFVRRGALLTGDDKEEYRRVTKELSQLSLAFGEHVLAETNDFTLPITNERDLSGLPDGVKEAAAALAKNKGLKGWLFTLHFPSYMPFMKYADNRELRKKMFLAYSKRGNRGNENDNNEIIKKMVSLRLKKANLLGYETHADYVLEQSMATSRDRVYGFLKQLLENSFAFAKKDVEAVELFARTQGLKGRLERWDYIYYAEKLKKEKLGLNDEMTRPYFELDRVEKGVLGLATRLYGLQFKENREIPTYHDEVKVFEVFDEKDTFLSVLYIDYFPRPSKQGGAWMTAFREQYIENGRDVRPLVSLVTNFTRPTKSKPSLLTFMEVKTFLHEFGHGLHGMLSKVYYESQSGTNVYRDFVELPSQLMENWATEKEWLQEVGIHYQTGEVMPDELINKLIESVRFQSGYAMIRQLSFGLNDMAWHTLTHPFDGDVNEFEKEAMKPTELFPPVEGTCMSTAFSHIFDGGYSAGYYGYKWAEVLDADAFDLFKERGIFNREVAHSFRKNVLEKGGTEHPMKLYKAFRGHEPSVEPLLQRSGLTKQD